MADVAPTMAVEKSLGEISEAIAPDVLTAAATNILRRPLHRLMVLDGNFHRLAKELERRVAEMKAHQEGVGEPELHFLAGHIEGYLLAARWIRQVLAATEPMAF